VKIDQKIKGNKNSGKKVHSTAFAYRSRTTYTVSADIGTRLNFKSYWPSTSSVACLILRSNVAMIIGTLTPLKLKGVGR
jgi:hypothetical protein